MRCNLIQPCPAVDYQNAVFELVSRAVPNMRVSSNMSASSNAHADNVIVTLSMGNTSVELHRSFGGVIVYARQISFYANSRVRLQRILEREFSNNL